MNEQETTAADAVWHQVLGDGPLIATAIHDGHELRPDVARHTALSDSERLREEDPFTGEWTRMAPTRVVGTRSRFEVDLNRPRDKAVYRSPVDAWGLSVWRDDPPPEMFARSLEQYDRFYAAMRELLEDRARRYGRFVVLDLHTYNHRRQGADGPEADVESNPRVNVGTGTMDRGYWSGVVDALIDSLRSHDFPGGALDVRENVKFFGGNWPRWIHENFPRTGVAVAIEFKKFFMDEWSGAPDRSMVDAIGVALRSTVPAVLEALTRY